MHSENWFSIPRDETKAHSSKITMEALHQKGRLISSELAIWIRWGTSWPI